MSSTNKSYNQIVATAWLIDYREELCGNSTIWSEYWVDEAQTYRAIFPEGYTNLPATIFTEHLC